MTEELANYIDEDGCARSGKLLLAGEKSCIISGEKGVVAVKNSDIRNLERLREPQRLPDPFYVSVMGCRVFPTEQALAKLSDFVLNNDPRRCLEDLVREEGGLELLTPHGQPFKSLSEHRTVAALVLKSFDMVVLIFRGEIRGYVELKTFEKRLAKNFTLRKKSSPGPKNS